jgi:hypothetical protein
LILNAIFVLKSFGACGFEKTYERKCEEYFGTFNGAIVIMVSLLTSSAGLAFKVARWTDIPMIMLNRKNIKESWRELETRETLFLNRVHRGSSRMQAEAQTVNPGLASEPPEIAAANGTWLPGRVGDADVNSVPMSTGATDRAAASDLQVRAQRSARLARGPSPPESESAMRCCCRMCVLVDSRIADSRVVDSRLRECAACS